jgi:hypothetical protein
MSILNVMRARALLLFVAIAAACGSGEGRGRPPAVPVGTVAAFTGEQVPEGWLLCDGRALRRRDWPALYAVLGTSHGAGVSEAGIPAGDFNLPDYRGRFLRGLDLSHDGRPSGADPDAATRGAARAGTGNAANRVGSYQPYATALPRDPTRPFLVGRDSERALVRGGEAETRPRNVAVRWIIRVRPQ